MKEIVVILIRTALAVMTCVYSFWKQTKKVVYQVKEICHFFIYESVTSYMSGRAETAVQFGHVLLLADLLRRAAAHQVAQRLDRLRDQGQRPVCLGILQHSKYLH